MKFQTVVATSLLHVVASMTFEAAPHLNLAVVHDDASTFTGWEKESSRPEAAHRNSMSAVSSKLTSASVAEAVQRSLFANSLSLKQTASLFTGSNELRSALLDYLKGFGGLNGARSLLNETIHNWMMKDDIVHDVHVPMRHKVEHRGQTAETKQRNVAAHEKHCVLHAWTAWTIVLPNSASVTYTGPGTWYRVWKCIRETGGEHLSYRNAHLASKHWSNEFRKKTQLVRIPNVRFSPLVSIRTWTSRCWQENVVSVESAEQLSIPKLLKNVFLLVLLLVLSLGITPKQFSNHLPFLW